MVIRLNNTVDQVWDDFYLTGLLKVLPKHIEDMDLHTGASTNNDPGLHLSTSLRVSLGRALIEFQ